MWDAFKVSTQGMYVSAIKAARAGKNSTSEEFQAHEIQCAKAHADIPSPSSLAELQMTRRYTFKVLLNATSKPELK